jgi:cytochrome c oxidase subunit 2
MAEQKTFLQSYPDYIAKVPDNLKAKAMKYLPADAPAVVNPDSVTAQSGVSAPVGASASLR